MVFSSSSGNISWPWLAPAAREMLSFISVPAEVVAAGLKRQFRALHAQLDPTDLDVVYVAVQGDTTDGVHLERLREGRSPATTALQKERGAHVDERAAARTR